MSKKPQALSKKEEDAIFAEAMQLFKLEKEAIDERDKKKERKKKITKKVEPCIRIPYMAKGQDFMKYI